MLKQITILRLIFVSLLIVLSGCNDKDKSEDTPSSKVSEDTYITGATAMENARIISQKKAAKGDIEAAADEVLFTIKKKEGETERRLIPIARKGSVRAAKHLYTGHTQGEFGMKKNCALAKEWYLILKKKAPGLFVKTQSYENTLEDISVYCP